MDKPPKPVSSRRGHIRPLLVIILLAGMLIAVAASMSVLRIGAEDGSQEALSAADRGMADAPSAYESSALDPSAQSGGADSGVAESASPDRDIVMTASQRVAVDDVAAAGQRLASAVAAAGGRVTAENTTFGAGCPQQEVLSGNPACQPQPSSVITYRAPLGAVDGLLAAAAGLGTEEWRTRSAADVTAQVADIDARVTSARASLDRLNALMTRAESLADVIALESQIATRQADLEALLAQQAALADQTSAATVTTTFTAPAASTAPDERSDGFLAGLRAGLDALGSAAVAGLTLLGALLPFAVVLAAAGVPIAVLVRRRRAPAPAAAAAEARSDDVEPEPQTVG